MSCRVTVTQGALQGKMCEYNGKKYYSFEGIPYAKPPVGKLRFREPQEPDVWSGVRDATKPGNRCIQMNPADWKSLIGSEDCLYLNVYTPILPEEQIRNLPVLFYVHGGKFVYGYGDYYRPDYLIDKDVIFVTINYRLHVLGFLSLYTAEAAGNMGLKDTVKALKWVKDNIRSFNGDDNNITVFGESAGAAVVTSYLTSNMTNGLFHKVIALSGCCLSDLFIIDDDPIFKAKHLASVLGKELKDVESLHEYLVNVPIESLVHAAGILELSRPPAIISAYFLPVVEKELDGIQRFFDEYPIKVFRQNQYKKVPVLFGVNSHEGALFTKQDKKGNIIYENDLRYFIPRYMYVNAYSSETLNIAKNIRNFYFDGSIVNAKKKVQYINFLSDAYFYRDILTFLDCFGKYYDGLYLFRLSYSGNMNTRIMKNIGIKGTTHGDLLQYYFYRKTKADSANEKDKVILTILNEIVCNFVKTGLPTWSKSPISWQPYSPEKRPFMDIDEEQKLLQNFGSDTYKFWCNMGERSKL